METVAMGRPKSKVAEVAMVVPAATDPDYPVLVAEVAGEVTAGPVGMVGAEAVGRP